MKILFDQFKNENYRGTSVPPHLKKFTVKWANSSFIYFDGGNLLAQEFKCNLFSIYIYRFCIEAPVHMYALFEKPKVVFQFSMNGNVSGTLKGGVDMQLDDGRYGLFYLPEGKQDIKFNTGLTESIHVELLPSLLEDLTTASKHIRILTENMSVARKKGMMLPTSVIDYPVRHQLTEMLSCNEAGNDLIVELKTAILNLLNLYRKSIKEEEALSKLPWVSNKQQLLDFWSQIKSNPNIHMHSLSRLSRESHLHMKTFNRSFRKLFSTDLSAFVYEQCMNKAYHLIINSDMSLEEIADELGYSELSSFSRAFKRRFDISPIILRTLKLV